MKKTMKKTILGFVIAFGIMFLQSGIVQAATSNLSGYKLEEYPKFPKVSQQYYMIYNEYYRNDRIEVCFFDVSNKKGSPYLQWNESIDVQNGEIKNDVKYYLSNSGKWVKFESDYGRISNHATGIIKSNLNVFNGAGYRVLKATPVKYIKFKKTTYKIEKGDRFTLPVKTNIKGKMKYKSSNSKVVKINSKGKIIAKKKGAATITVTAPNGMKAKCKVKVR